LPPTSPISSTPRFSKGCTSTRSTCTACEQTNSFGALLGWPTPCTCHTSRRSRSNPTRRSSLFTTSCRGCLTTSLATRPYRRFCQTNGCKNKLQDISALV
jgi:hypothetical protein